MSFGKNDIPSIKEAALFATILDENGYYDDANLLDEFVEQCSENKNDFVKNAGLWSGIWNRLSGWAKRVFFKEYRELYKIAKEANEKISERVEEAQKLWKEAQKDFNNYELVLWREKILSLPVFTKDLMVNYEKAFGNLVAFTYKLQDTPSSTKEKGILEITPPGEGGEGKVEPPKEEGVPEKKELKELDDPWFYTTGVKSIMENGQTGEIAIEQERLKRSMKWGQVIYVNGEKDLIKYNDKYKGKATRGLKEALGDDIWQISTAPSGGWVFLIKYEKGVGEEPKQSFETIEEPSLPEEMKRPEYLREMSEEVPQGIEMSKETPEEKVIELTKKKETPEEKVIELTKKKEIPLQGKWVVFLTGPNKGKAGLVRKPQPRWHWMITDKDELERLNNVYKDIYKVTGGKVPAIPYEGEKIPEEAMNPADDSMISNLLDTIMKKESLTRAERINKVLLLTKK